MLLPDDDLKKLYPIINRVTIGCDNRDSIQSTVGQYIVSNFPREVDEIPS